MTHQIVVGAEISLAQRGIFLLEVGIERHHRNLRIGGLDGVRDQRRVRRRDRDRDGVGFAEHVLDDLGFASLIRGRRRPGLLPKHVVVAALRSESRIEDVRVGIAADEVIGTYSVKNEDFLEQAPENVPHCIGMLRHDDRLALVIDLRRLLEVFPGPSI